MSSAGRRRGAVAGGRAMFLRTVSSLCALAALALGACAPSPARPLTDSERVRPPEPALKKSVTAAVMGSLFTVSSTLAVSGASTNIPGTAEIEKLVNAGLAIVHTQGLTE